VIGKKEPYKPDYLLYGKKKARWIIDAKAVGENPDDFVGQGSFCQEQLDAFSLYAADLFPPPRARA
jgi:hypothetical protein